MPEILADLFVFGKEMLHHEFVGCCAKGHLAIEVSEKMRVSVFIEITQIFEKVRYTTLSIFGDSDFYRNSSGYDRNRFCF